MKPALFFSLLLVLGTIGCQSLVTDNMTALPTSTIPQLAITCSADLTWSVIVTPTVQPAAASPVVSIPGLTSTLSGTLVVVAHQIGEQTMSSKMSHLVLIDLPEGNRFFLTGGLGQDQQPRWSPDGQRIAFSSNRNGSLDIFLVHRDGTGLTQLTTGPGDKDSPAWSPDGKRLAFVLRQRQDGGNTAIQIIDLETKQITNLHQVEWSIDGPAIQYVAWSPVNENLLLYTKSERLGVQQSDIGAKGYYDDQVYLYDIRKSQSTSLMPEGWACSEPHWSPDGVSILMNFCINYAGVPDTSFTKEGTLIETESGFVLRNIYTLYDISGCRASWSPNGKMWVATCTKLDKGGKIEIYMRPAIGVNLESTLLYTLNDPLWSFDDPDWHW